MSSILECRHLHYHYRDGNHQTEVLKNLNLVVQSGQSLAILGQSGCGKSTLLHLLGGMSTPSSGQVLLNSTDLGSLDETQRTNIRAKCLGFVYQFHHLLKDFTALDNVALPLRIQGQKQQLATEKATTLLNHIGLGDRLDHRPSALSGGERQRVAIARALITQPSCLLADEPTGNLDAHTATEVLSLMVALNQQQGSALVLVTHDEKIAAKMQTVLVLRNGQLV